MRGMMFVILTQGEQKGRIFEQGRARYAGHADHFGKRDAVALLFVIAAAIMHWKREALIAWLA